MNKFSHFLYLFKGDAGPIENVRWRSLGGYVLGAIVLVVMLIHTYYALFLNYNLDNSQDVTLFDLSSPYIYIFFSILISICLIKYGLRLPCVASLVLFLVGFHFGVVGLIKFYILSVYFIPILDWMVIIFTFFVKKGEVRSYENKFIKISSRIVAIFFLIPICLSCLLLFSKFAKDNLMLNEVLLNLVSDTDAIFGFYIPSLIAIRLFLFQPPAWLLGIYLFASMPLAYLAILFLLAMRY